MNTSQNWPWYILVSKVYRRGLARPHRLQSQAIQHHACGGLYGNTPEAHEEKECYQPLVYHHLSPWERSRFISPHWKVYSSQRPYEPYWKHKTKPYKQWALDALPSRHLISEISGTWEQARRPFFVTCIFHMHLRWKLHPCYLLLSFGPTRKHLGQQQRCRLNHSESVSFADKRNSPGITRFWVPNGPPSHWFSSLSLVFVAMYA